MATSKSLRADQPNDLDHEDLANEVRAEQEQLDHAERCLAAMQGRAAKMIKISDRMVRDEDTVDAKVARFHLGRREASLSETKGPLCFGRIDTDERQTWYVGRRHVEDDHAQPVVVDWRAPVSAAFYRATAIDPCGLDFRRRFIIEDKQITALLDEHLDDPEGGGGGGGLPDPLLAELERSRTGQMRDIVATIAAEQDVIIRAPLQELLIVQGGPGTGKTAVGLHRAAFLLFEYREELTDSTVLVIGPNPLFLRYISEVLPSLGETSVSQATIEGLVGARYRVRGTDTDDVGRLKARVDMAAVVATAARGRIKPLADGLELRSGLAVVRFDTDELEQLQQTVLSRRMPLNDGQAVFRRLLLQEAWRRHAARPGIDPATEPVFTAGIRSDRMFKSAVDKMWPTTTAIALVRGLYGSPKKMSEAAAGLLDEAEQAALRRKLAKKPAEEAWTVHDLPILDEANYVLAGVPATYGHVVVDEAQDLSPMAMRMVARRAEGGSMTILGDLAQATTPQAAGSWEITLDALTGHLSELSALAILPPIRRADLTVGYRLPAAILDAANRLLVEAAPEVTPTQSVRSGGDPPLVLPIDASGLARALVDEVSALRERTSSIAVVATEDSLPQVGDLLVEAGIPADRVGGRGLPGEEAVALVSPLAVKGLEFDAVVIIEPADIADLESGLRHLYVAMTRPVQHLGIIHQRPLPALLAL